MMLIWFYCLLSEPSFGFSWARGEVIFFDQIYDRVNPAFSPKSVRQEKKIVLIIKCGIPGTVFARLQRSSLMFTRKFEINMRTSCKQPWLMADRWFPPFKPTLRENTRWDNDSRNLLRLIKSKVHSPKTTPKSSHRKIRWKRQPVLVKTFCGLSMKLCKDAEKLIGIK